MKIIEDGYMAVSAEYGKRRVRFIVEEPEQVNRVVDDTFFMGEEEAVEYGRRECEGVCYVAGDLFEFCWLVVREKIKRTGMEVRVE